ncbi:MAG: AMP nucleosidase [Brachymonas sp.]|nr:AMP nucleosidase [Brachymonas sp.]
MSHAHDNTPPYIAPQPFSDADAALAQVQTIYQQAVEHLRHELALFMAAGDLPHKARAFYPQVRVHTQAAVDVPRGEIHRTYGFVSSPGVHQTTLTAPDLFADYYREQFELLLAQTDLSLEVGTSQQPIALHFALDPSVHHEGSLTPEQRQRMKMRFDWPDLYAMDDSIANGTLELPPGAPQPLALFTAPRVDYSLQRLRHYSGTDAQHFQNFVLFTNYQFYIDEFIRLGQQAMQDDASGYTAFVEPGNVVTHHMRHGAPADFVQGTHPTRPPQMPAYHLVRPGHSGITMINIGVGPSNAKTMSDHVAVLRPHAWIMLGHCAGLRNSQRLGDYVLAHGYVRDDHVLDDDLPLWVPVPALAEIQQALQQAVADVTQLRDADLKAVLRTGTVATTDNRNWELQDNNLPVRRFSQSRAIAIDMESATVAANGLRFRVPYGTLLCVSDKPMHGEIKLPGMADHFYRQRVDQHLRIGIRALELLRENGVEQLHSRKLRSFQEVAFQ